MSQRSIWDVLGIEATEDERELKRAYARRLKVTQPEDDPEAFKELRAAYDMAWRHLYVRRQEALEAALESEGASSGESGPGAVAQSAPPPPQTEPAPVVEIVQPLSQRPMTEEERFNAAFQAEVEALHAEVAEMRQMLEEKPVRIVAVRSKFEAILASPALDNLDFAGGFESWIEQMLMSATPASDPLMSIAINHFRWLPDEYARYRRVGDMALAREDDLQVLRQLARKSHSQHAAFKALTSPATRPNRLRWQAGLGLEERVMELLDNIRTNRPGLIRDLDPEAVAWWEADAQRPRIGPAAALVILMTPVLDLLAARPGGIVGWWPLSLCISLVLGGAYFHGVARARIGWRAGEAETAPLWKRFGWVGAGLLLPVLGTTALVSGIEVTVWVPALTAIALLTASWARVTGETVYTPIRQQTVGFTGLQRTVRWVGRGGYLMVLWLVSATAVGGERWPLMLLAGAGSILVFLTGAGALQALVEGLSPKVRRRWYIPLMAVCGLLVALCEFVSGTSVGPWLAAMAGVVGLVDFVLDRLLLETDLGLRGWLGLPLLFGSLFVTALIHGEIDAHFGMFGGWILAQVVLSLWLARMRDIERTGPFFD